MARALRQYGSQSKEYRRTWRKTYREKTWRVDYSPDFRAAKALDAALANDWARSYTEAIDLALADWARGLD